MMAWPNDGLFYKYTILVIVHLCLFDRFVRIRVSDSHNCNVCLKQPLKHATHFIFVSPSLSAMFVEQISDILCTIALQFALLDFSLRLRIGRGCLHCQQVGNRW